MQIRNFVPRQYQLNILNVCKNKNTLVCIPTGLGKTKIAILLAVEQLNKHKDTKVLILTPTRPLANQIFNEFKDCINIEGDKINLMTGALNPNKRSAVYESSQIIIATPQTIQEDIENNRIGLENFSLLTIDEAHRSREKFANTVVAKNYVEKSKYGKILALTASPGSTRAKIDEIFKNLNIEAVEIRTEQDEDVLQYVQDKNVEYIDIELPEKIKFIHHLVKEFYVEKLDGLKNFNILKPKSQITKVDLLMLQQRLQRSSKTSSVFYGLSLTAQLLKLNFAMEMIETQGLSSFHDFISKLEKEDTKAAKIIMNSNNIVKARNLCRELLKEGIDHPKIDKLKEVVANILSEKKDSRIIIFVTYRNTIDNILKVMKDIEVKTIKLVGQKEGLTQKQQVDSIERFNAGEYSCLVTTSIGEEGIHIGEADAAIFFDNTPSSIRKIQRAGRVGRLKPGKVIFMVTKGTRDAAYYWKSKKDETRMKNILYKLKDQKINLKEKPLTEF